MSQRLNRREMLRLTGGALLAGAFAPQGCVSAPSADPRPDSSPKALGVVAGDPDGAAVGARVLVDGGNAIDAVVAAALATCVVANSKCGLGGYGGHMVIALAGGRKITCIDFNTAAPAAARPDMFPLDARGNVIGGINTTGWLAAGVPGTLAGIQMALSRYGTKSFRELAQPAVKLARDGFPVSVSFAGAIRAAASQLRRFPASAKLLLKGGQAYKPGETFRNPDLADLLSKLAERNSVDSFYRGDIAAVIADAFQKNGGIVTAKDFANYRAREVKPLRSGWNDFTIHTAPLTAGGLSILQAMNILHAMEWTHMPEGPSKSHARLEALRLSWRDRLGLLGDPDKSSVPVERLLSKDYANKLAAEVLKAVNEKKALVLSPRKEADDGTMNLGASDQHGNMAAITLTHGGSFGSKVTVEGLGLVLGHGMSRFNPNPGHPNSVAAGKRPLHNMCPTIVTRNDLPVLAIGAAGGRMIPNTVFDILTRFVAEGKSMSESMAAPRLHTEGDMRVRLEPEWPTQDAEYFKELGYKIEKGKCAFASAASFNTKTAECEGLSR